jgi:hypothetical protein
VNDYRWSLGTLIWLPIGGALLLICIGLAVWLFFVWRRLRQSHETWERNDAGPALGLSALAVVCALTLIGGTAWGMWPYSAEYHQWRTESGTVQQIDSRLLAGQDGPTERYVVTYEDGRQRSCDDTRCAQVGEGDVLTLSCKRAWQWAGSHGYDCNFLEAGAQ